jgi:uncharacterized protein YcbX
VTTAKVTGLWIYPVKSCRGIALSEMQIGPTGPINDRRWMLVDSENNFITLRTHARLAEIKTSIQGSFLHLYAGTNKILLDTTNDCEKVEEVTVWGDRFLAGIESKDINEALSDFLSSTVKLVRYQKESFRDLQQAATNVAKEMMFADGRPVLLANENSLLDLNSKLLAQGLEPSVMERFRANIIIDGLEAFAEDKIQEVQIGEAVFTNPKLCARCPIVTQDIETGKVVSKETLKTLASYRKVGSKNGVMFGLNLTPSKLGLIRLNDRVLILK